MWDSASTRCRADASGITTWPLPPPYFSCAILWASFSFPLTMMDEDDEGIGGQHDTGQRGDYQADSSGRRKSVSRRPRMSHGWAKGSPRGVLMR